MFSFVSRCSAANVLRDFLRSANYSPLSEPSFTPTSIFAAPQLLTARDAAKVLAVCEKTLWSLTERGEIPVVRIGRSVRYDPQDLADWIAKNKSVANK